MKNNIDEERLFRILLEQGLINEQQQAAYFTYQEEQENRTGERAPVARVLQKLDILTADQISSIMKAIDTVPPVAASPVPSSKFSVMSSQSIGNVLGEKPTKISPAKLFAPPPESEDEEESSKPISKIERPKANILEKLSAGLESSEKISLETPSLLNSPRHKVELPPEIAQAIEEQKSPLKEPFGLLDLEKKEETSNQEMPSQKDEYLEKYPPKSLFLSYLLLLTSGILGGHRFYLRCYRSAFWYLFSFGFCGVGVVIDIFLLPWLLNRYRRFANENQSPSLWKDLHSYQNIQNDCSANPDWSYKETAMQKLGGALEVFIKLIMLLVAPVLLGFVAVMLWQPIIPLIMLVWGIIFLGNLKFNQEWKTLSGSRHIPFFGLISQKISQFTGFYFENKPYPTIIYLLYPLWMPIAILISEKRRKEALAHLWIMMLVMGGILLGLIRLAWIFSFEYSQPIVDLFLYQGAIWLSSLILLLALGMPTFTALASFRIQHHEKTAKFFAGWNCFVYAGVLGLLLIGPNFLNWESYSHQSALRLAVTKFKVSYSSKEISKPELQKVCENAFEYIMKNITQNPSDANLTSKGICIAETNTFQKLVSGYFKYRQSQVFQIHFLKENNLFVLYMGSYPITVWNSVTKSIVSEYKLGDPNHETMADSIKRHESVFVVCPVIEQYRKWIDIPYTKYLVKVTTQD